MKPKHNLSIEYLKLTDIHRGFHYINYQRIIAFTSTDDGMTKVTTDRTDHFVKESPDEIAKLLDDKFLKIHSTMVFEINPTPSTTEDE